MNMFLIYWAIFLFMIGLILSLPVAGIYYFNIPLVRKFFTNPRKLTSAHLDYFMQAFSISIIFLLEFGMDAAVPTYIVIPLAFGTFFNPTIFLLESTPLYNAGLFKYFYTFVKFVSPASLFFAWFGIFFQYVPTFYTWLFVGVIIVFIALLLFYIKETKPMAQKKDSSAKENV